MWETHIRIRRNRIEFQRWWSKLLSKSAEEGREGVRTLKVDLLEVQPLWSECGPLAVLVSEDRKDWKTHKFQSLLINVS